MRNVGIGISLDLQERTQVREKEVQISWTSINISCAIGTDVAHGKHRTVNYMHNTFLCNYLANTQAEQPGNFITRYFLN
jgi:hypothetical protein